MRLPNAIAAKDAAMLSVATTSRLTQLTFNNVAPTNRATYDERSYTCRQYTSAIRMSERDRQLA